MVKKRTERGKEIRKFLLKNVTRHPRDLVKVAYEHFHISRQAIARYVRELVNDGYVEARGTTRQRNYSLVTLEKLIEFQLEGLEEDEAWRSEIGSLLNDLPENVLDIWNYGFTEMVNNAVDHSGGDQLVVKIKKNAVETEMTVADDGVGIFRKIKEEFGLDDERHALLELAKGKLTTDPDRHTGEGIFFTSRMFDSFDILSGSVYFSHLYGQEEDWLLERERSTKGTTVFMRIDNDAQRRTSQVFEEFAAEGEDYGFTKTVVPVRMARHGAEKLVSRSQAKRLLARVERFDTVLFDFRDVEYAGRAFIDEVFRVFAKSHPNTIVLQINVNEKLNRMIASAKTSGE